MGVSMKKNIYFKDFKNKNFDFDLNSKKDYFSGFDRDLFFKKRRIIAEQLNTKLTIYI